MSCITIDGHRRGLTKSGFYFKTILGLEGHVVSIATTHLCHCSQKSGGDRAEGDAFWRVCSGFGEEGASLPIE